MLDLSRESITLEVYAHVLGGEEEKLDFLPASRPLGTGLPQAGDAEPRNPAERLARPARLERATLSSATETEDEENQ